MAINQGRNKSKSKRYMSLFNETRDQKADRLHATKRNSKKKVLQAKYAKPKETVELKSERLAQAKAAALKMFQSWLERPEISRFSGEIRYYSLSHLVEVALNDCLNDYIAFQTLNDKVMK